MNRISSLLTVGTEITDGDILNSNSHWISQSLFEVNWRVQHQISVPDEKKLILDALEFLFSRSDLIVVTGGLGPTSDDITRNVVAEFVQEELVFDQTKWRELEALYVRMQMNQHEGHRLQALFPKNCKVLKNENGTADGFWVKKNHCDIVVLPGPPRELKPIWQNSVLPQLTVSDEQKSKFFHFKVLGVPESEIAAPTEKLFASEEGVRLGFRAQVPFVHVKLLMTQRRAIELESKIARLEDILGPYRIPLDDLALPLAQHLATLKISIVDEVTKGQLRRRLYESILKTDIEMPSISLIEDLPSAIRISNTSTERVEIRWDSFCDVVNIPSRILTRPSILPAYVTEFIILRLAFRFGFDSVKSFSSFNFG